jgi:hypothetical protein
MKLRTLTSSRNRLQSTASQYLTPIWISSIYVSYIKRYRRGGECKTIQPSNTDQLTPQRRVLFVYLTVAELVSKWPTFTEPENSLPCPQKPASCHDPEQRPWVTFHALLFTLNTKIDNHHFSAIRRCVFSGQIFVINLHFWRHSSLRTVIS